MLTIVKVLVSENVHAFAWSAGTLYIQFKSNLAVYSYEDVPEELFHEMRHAESVGKFFHKFIGRKFVTTQVPVEVGISLGFSSHLEGAHI